MRIWGKNHCSVGGRASRSPCCYSHLYCYKFVPVYFVSSAKCVLFPSKKNKITTVNVLPLILPHFCTYFSHQSL